MKPRRLAIPLALLALALLALDLNARPQNAGGSVEAREHLRRGIELARQGLHDGAVAELRSAVEGLPSDPDVWFHLGRSLLEVARENRTPLRPAIDALEKALRLDPSRDFVRVQLAEVYGQRIPGSFQPEAAIRLYEELIKRHPDSPEAHLNLATWLITAEIRLARTGDPHRVLQDSAWTMDLARFHLEKAIDMAPRESDTSIEARTFLGEVQFRSGEWDAARAIYEQLIAQLSQRGGSANLAPAWNTIGHCRWRRKQYTGALEAFRKAYDLTPSLAHLWDIKTACDELGGCPPGLPERYIFPLRDEIYDRSAPPALKFSDIAPKLHINKLAGAGPAGWADYDGDGRYDLIACGCDTFCTLYQAQGDSFTDATIKAGLARTEPGFGSVWGDYDNDGDADLYIARNGWNGPAPDSLLRNNGDGTFTDVAAKTGVADPGSGFNPTWVDYDRDGWLDLIVSNGVYIDGSTNQLYHNNKDGTFANVTRQAGLAEEPHFGTIGVAVGDYDDDGWVDIFYHGRMTTNRLYRNNHDGTFTNVAAKAGVAGPGTQNGYIALLVDFDSDGDLDIFTASLAPWEHVLAGYRPDYKPGPLDNIPRFYRNKGDGTFADESLTSGLRYPLGVMSGSAADLDNDGYPDILLGTGNPELRRQEPNIFYHNRGGRGFEDLTRLTGLGSLCKGHGVTFLDWDRDGDLDSFVELGGFFHGDWCESAFYLNEQGNRNHWLGIKLSQPELNRHAIGARVTVRAQGLASTQHLTAGRGFGSTDPPELHFGLGKRTRADSVEIRWPDGTSQTLAGVKADQTIEVRRGRNRPR